MIINSGTAKGRMVAIPENVAVRPTADKVKQALFNRIDIAIRGRKVLDLFCGSGNLGLEALSRGADRVVFADRHARCTANAGDHAVAFGFGPGKWSALAAEWEPVVRRLDLLGERFDFIFLDPPYNKGFEEALLNDKSLASLAKNSCLLSLEHSAQTDPAFETDYWLREKSDIYGDTTLSLYKKK